MVSVSIPLLVFLRIPESLDKEDRLLYFQTADMAECLAGPGYNAERLSVPYVPQVTGTTGRVTLTHTHKRRGALQTLSWSSEGVF